MSTMAQIFLGLISGLVIVALLYPYYSIPDISKSIDNLAEEVEKLREELKKK